MTVSTAEPKGRRQRIFVSYARKDGAELALRLQRDLTAAGCDVWLDTQRIGGGASWTLEIEQAIDRAHVVLALLTPGSYLSGICRAEQLRSLRKGKCVIPLLAARGSDIPLHLEAKNYRNFGQKRAYTESFQFLLKDIKARKGVALLPLYRTTLTTYITAPPTVAHYIERPEAIRAVRDVLFGAEGQGAVALTALKGMGGVGKTVLAQALFKDEVVHQAFPDGLVWITVGREHPADLTPKLREITAVLGGDSDESVPAEILYRTTIASKAALVVIDDIWSKSDLDTFLAESQRSRFVFTTRQGSIAHFSGAREYRVDLLDEKQARELLGRWAGLEVAQLPAAADDVLGECGGLPLAISSVGALLQGAADAEWADTAKLLHDADLAAIEEQLPPGQDSFFRAIDVSVKALSAEMRHRYGRLAVLLEDMVASLPVLQTLWNVDIAGARRIGRGLAERSLAQRDDEGGIRLHDLQLDYLKAQYPDREGLALIRHAVQLSSHVIGADPLQFASQVLGRLLPRRKTHAIQQFIDEITEGSPSPWLRPLLPALDPPGAPLFPPRKGHYSGVVAVALTTDGRRAISASEDETLKVWDLETGLELFTLRGHTSAVRGIAISADGRCAVSASSDKTLKVWDLETGREVRTLTGHSRGVISVAVSPDGRRALSASWDATLKLWDLETQAELKDFKGHSKSLNFVAVSADWKVAVSASEDTTLKVWDVEAGRLLRTLEGHTADVWGVALTADGRVAVSASEDKELKVWDVEAGTVLRTLRGHTSSVYGVALSPDNRFVVSASDDETLKVWDLATGSELQILKGHSTTVYGVAVSADSRFVVSACYDATLKVWDLESGRELRTLEGHSDALNAVSVSEDGKLGVFASDDKTLKVWDLHSAREVRTLAGHASFVYDVAVSRDGRWALSASADETVKMWNLATGAESRTLRGHDSFVHGIAASADWRIAVSASDDKTLKVWNLETGEELRVLRGHDSSVYGVALTADGTRAVSASYDATVRIWDVGSGRELHRLKYHSEPITFVALSPDGRLGVSASDDCLVSDDGTIKVWEVETGRFLRSLGGHSDSVSYLAFSPDGTRLLSASWDKTLKLWNFETGSLLATFTCDAPMLCCRFIQDSKIICGDHLGRIHLLSPESGNVRQRG